MELEEFYDGERTIKPKVNKRGSTLTITYDPRAVTRKELRLLTDIEYLVKVVRKWDLTHEGKPVPVTAEAIEDLPGEFIRTVVGWVRADNEEIPKEKWTLSQSGSASGQASEGEK